METPLYRSLTASKTRGTVCISPIVNFTSGEAGKLILNLRNKLHCAQSELEENALEYAVETAGLRKRVAELEQQLGEARRELSFSALKGTCNQDSNETAGNKAAEPVMQSFTRKISAGPEDGLPVLVGVQNKEHENANMGLRAQALDAELVDRLAGDGARSQTEICETQTADTQKVTDAPRGEQDERQAIAVLQSQLQAMREDHEFLAQEAEYHKDHARMADIDNQSYCGIIAALKRQTDEMADRIDELEREGAQQKQALELRVSILESELLANEAMLEARLEAPQQKESEDLTRSKLALTGQQLAMTQRELEEARLDEGLSGVLTEAGSQTDVSVRSQDAFTTKLVALIKQKNARLVRCAQLLEQSQQMVSALTQTRVQSEPDVLLDQMMKLQLRLDREKQ